MNETWSDYLLRCHECPKWEEEAKRWRKSAVDLANAVDNYISEHADEISNRAVMYGMALEIICDDEHDDD